MKVFILFHFIQRQDEGPATTTIVQQLVYCNYRYVSRNCRELYIPLYRWFCSAFPFWTTLFTVYTVASKHWKRKT